MRYPTLVHTTYPATGPAYEEIRAPVLSMFEQLITDFFQPLGPIKEADVKSRSYPKVDVRRSGYDLIFEAAVPFVKKEDLDISLDKNSLRISGRVTKKESLRDELFIKRELVRSSFYRSFTLDESLCKKWEKEGGLVKADLSEGLLTIILTSFFADQIEEAPQTRKITLS